MSFYCFKNAQTWVKSVSVGNYFPQRMNTKQNKKPLVYCVYFKFVQSVSRPSECQRVSFISYTPPSHLSCDVMIHAGESNVLSSAGISPPPERHSSPPLCLTSPTHTGKDACQAASVTANLSFVAFHSSLLLFDCDAFISLTSPPIHLLW